MSHNVAFDTSRGSPGRRRAGRRLPRATLLSAALVCAVSALAALMVPARAAAQQSQKLGFVDSNKIIEATPGVTEAKASYEKQAQGWRDSLMAKQKELNDLQDEYKKQAAILSPEKKTEKEQLILQKTREAQDYFTAKFDPQKGEAATRERELLRPIYDRVNKAIEQVRAEEGYALIFDVQAGALAAGDPSLDLTDKVVAKLKAEGATASTAPAPGPAAGGASGNASASPAKPGTQGQGTEASSR